MVSQLIPDGIPQKTLGWGVLGWGTTWLRQPDGPDLGGAWQYSPEQARFILWWYAVNDSGEFLYRRGVLMRPKGWGKSPLIAAISCTELLGPVVFDRFDDNGFPIGKPYRTPRVQIAAVSEAQTDNTLELCREMLGQGPARDAFGLDIGKTRILCPHGILEPVTANSRSREGQRPDFVVEDEVHHWIPSNHGDELDAVVRRNLGKRGGRSIATTNAFKPGERSVAEGAYEYYQSVIEGKKVDPGLLFDHRFAPLGTPSYACPERRSGLILAYGDSSKEAGGWVDLDRIEAEIDDPTTTESDARRYYFNQIYRGSSGWLNPDEFNACKGLSKVMKDEPITIGFDGSIRNDSTAIVGCRISDGFIWPIRVWEKPDDSRDWEVPFLEVDAVMRDVLDTYDVRWVYADPAYWQDIVGKWSADYPDTVYEFWTHRRNRMCSAVERFETAVQTRTLSWSGAPDHKVLGVHVMNAHVTELPAGKLIRKESKGSSRKIDAAMAAVLAFEARGDYVTSGDTDDADNCVYSF